jgi:hypothetical protein
MLTYTVILTAEIVLFRHKTVIGQPFHVGMR